MAGSKQTDSTTPAEPQVTQEDDGEVSAGRPISSWEFIDIPPTAAEVLERLNSLPDIWGVRHADFVEYVQPLSQSKDLSTTKGVKDYHQVWNLYFTVAGRIAMITQAAIINEWSVSFEPEEFGERHGFVEYGERIVYREYCHVMKVDSEKDKVIDLGRKPGTAWVPNVGGSGAVSSNRFEKVETSARGRSIAAWGFGVIPGSGVASFDEMLMINDNRQSGQSRGRGQQQPAAPRQNRGELEGRLRVAIGTYRQLTGISEEQSNTNSIDYAQRTFAKTLAVKDDGSLDLSLLKEGELALFVRTVEQEVLKAQAAQSGFSQTP